MTPEESSWENEGGACRPEPGESELVYTPACTSALKPWELATVRLLAEAFFGSVQALEDGNLEGLEMAESETFDYAEVAS